MNLNREKQVALLAAKKAGAELLKHFTKISRAVIKTKSKHEIITPADLASEKIILNLIKKKFPSHAILSEEAGQNKKHSDYLWVIDPLDGTTNFAMGNPLFSISIALAYKNEVVMGLVTAPYLKEIYLATKNHGAFLNGKKISVSQEREITNSLLTYCHGNNNQSIKRAIKIHSRLKFLARDIRQIGSAAIEMTWVARGRTDAIIIPGVRPWDIAAGVLIVLEANGQVTDLKGETWHLKTNDVYASNGLVHDKLLKLIQ